jgi:ribosomal protein L11 methyltransferase
MKKPALLKITVTTTAEAEEVVGLALEKVLAQPASVYANERTKVSTVSVYCTKLSDWSPARRLTLLAELRGIKAAGLRLGNGKITAKLLPRENWAESWKKHFKPIEVGAALLVKPGWIKQRPRKGQVEVILDPGLSFGTGHHATTGFCLAQLVRSRTTGRRQSFLDIGTGSGILAIAAAKLGYAPVEAFDFDPESVRVAKENAQANGVGKSVQLRQQDLTKLPRRSAKQFDFVCANLISHLLVAERERIVNRLRPGGILVLAGILKREFGEVQRVYELCGLRLIAARSEKEWRSGAFTGTGHLYS